MTDQTSDSPKDTQTSSKTIRVVIVVLVVLGFIWGEWSPVVPSYRGKATIRVSQRMDANILVSSEQNSGSDYYSRRLNTIVASLANTELMKQVITDHDLLNNETFAGPDASAASLDSLSRGLVWRTSASLREGSDLIDVSVVSKDQDLAMNLVNWVCQGFIRQHATQRLNRNHFANQVLKDETERLKLKLRNAEVALIDFRRTSKLLVSLEERQSIVGSRIASLHQSRNNADWELARVEADLALLSTFGDEPTVAQFDRVESIRNSEEVNRYRNMLAEVELKADESSLLYDESHPIVVSKTATLKRVEARLFESMKKRADRLEADYLRMRKERDLISEQLSMAEQESLTVSEDAVEYNMLEREVEGTKVLYSAVLDRTKEIDRSTGLAEEVINIVESAADAGLSSPSRSLQILKGGLIGLVVALTGVYLFDNPPYRLKRKN